jgi:hypothetical protein
MGVGEMDNDRTEILQPVLQGVSGIGGGFREEQ